MRRLLVLALSGALAIFAGAVSAEASSAALMSFAEPAPQNCDEPELVSHPLLLAQQGCCSSHNGVCGCSGAGKTLCCDGTQSPTCTCSPPPPSHTLTITAGPIGTPNPVASESSVSLTVTAADSLGHALSYAWTASCSTLSSNGTLNNATLRTPTWTAPANTTGSQRNCTIQVTVNDGQGLSRSGSFSQAVNPASPPPPPPPPPHTLTITAGPSGAPNPVASGATVNLSVAAVDSLGHALGYGWVTSCPSLPSNGSFNNAAALAPAWTAPTNDTVSQQNCTVQVTVTDGGNGLSQTASFVQGVLPLPPPPPPPPVAPSLTIEVIVTGCTTCHSGQIVAYHTNVNNPGPPLLVEYKAGARFPDGSILPLVNTVTTIPSGASTLDLVPSQALPAGLPTIDLGIEAAILEPALGVTISRHNVTLHLLP